MKPKSYLRIPLWWPSVPRNWRSWLPSRGNVIFTLLMISLLLWAQTAGAIPMPGAVNAPDVPSSGTIAYQGRLADASGTPLTSTVPMEFRLYSAPTGSAPLWEEFWTGANSVQVSDGLFNVMLGSLIPIPQSIVIGNASLFLGITAGTDDEMMPRVQLGSVPFAVQALTVPDGSVTTPKIADRAIRTQHLNLTSGTSCLASQANLISPGGQPVIVPGLSLSIALDRPSKVLIWIDGIAHSVQEPPDTHDVVYHLLIDGVSQGFTIDTDNDYWENLQTERLIDLVSGTHEFRVGVGSYKQASIWMNQNTCIYYLVLGG